MIDLETPASRQDLAKNGIAFVLRGDHIQQNKVKPETFLTEAYISAMHAAIFGQIPGPYFAAAVHYHGYGTPVDFAKATCWLVIGAKMGDKYCKSIVSKQKDTGGLMEGFFTDSPIVFSDFEERADHYVQAIKINKKRHGEANREITVAQSALAELQIFYADESRLLDYFVTFTKSNPDQVEFSQEQQITSILEEAYPELIGKTIDYDAEDHGGCCIIM